MIAAANLAAPLTGTIAAGLLALAADVDAPTVIGSVSLGGLVAAAMVQVVRTMTGDRRLIELLDQQAKAGRDARKADAEAFAAREAQLLADIDRLQARIDRLIDRDETES